jgi:phenylalanyl-tRNA synthetase beta chain
LPLTGFTLGIDDAAPIRGRIGSTVFTLTTVRGVDPSRPTPPWMIARLALAGIRSISLVVDITNYVMLELGQPTHAYDLDKITGAITVRRALAGEKLETLDGQSRTLSAEDLLITDESGAIGLAGVMGGAATEISDSTTNVLVEAANFDPVSIARSARRHKLPSEASRRFERGVDPEVAKFAAARVVQLLVELAGGTPDSLGAYVNTSPRPEPILLPDDYVSSLIGVRYSADEITESLEMIGATLATGAGALEVTPPTWRPDLTDKATLAEEVARIVGYERIPSELPVAPPGRGLTRAQRFRRAAAHSLAASGAVEVLAYPFLAKTVIDRLGVSATEAVSAIKLANPLDAEAAWLRTSLIPGLIDIARRNLSRGLTDLSLFEVGVVVQPVDGQKYGSGPLPVGNARPSEHVLAELNASIPPQPWHVGAIFVGDAVAKQPGQVAVAAGISDAIDAAHALAASVGATLRIAQGSHRAMHPGRTAELFVGETSVGFAGELLPAIAEDRDLPRVVGLLEVDLDLLSELAPAQVVPTPISGFPAATQDVSLVVGADVPAGDVLRAVIDGAGDLLESARLVDDYRGSGIPDGSKSLTFALRFRSGDRTLTAAEATDAKNAAVALAGKRVNATLRE